jgi:hypothetical protein
MMKNITLILRSVRSQIGGHPAAFAFIVAVLLAIPVSQSNAAEVTAIRANSEAGMTRIVIQFSESTQYQARYTSMPSISVCLPKARLGRVENILEINDELVETVSLREIMNDMVDVSIQLRRPADFTVFPVELPDRLVIDITPCRVGVPQSRKPENQMAESLENQESQIKKQESKIPLLPFRMPKHAMTRFCFDAFLIVSLIVMALNLWRVAKVSKRSPNALKKYQTFADIVYESNRSYGGNRKNRGKQSNVIARATNSEVGWKKGKRNGNDTQAKPPAEQCRKVQELAQLGMDRLAISRQSKVPIGEVNLILDLSMTDSKDRPN